MYFINTGFSFIRESMMGERESKSNASIILNFISFTVTELSMMW